ncbi:MAG: hypothetical protein KBD24_04125 [Candidatus Pacebacteria bacterium]|nr:hypothetical protein [Candidatus Paceibacterota bacterium]
MIDTIIISIPKTLVLERGHNSARAWEDWDQKSSNKMGAWKTFIWNSYAPISGDYYPVVNGYFRARHGNSPAANIVKVQFSAPKVLFGQNLDEVSDADFEELVSVLARTLHSMGLSVSPETLREARVVNCHYSKNILLPHGITVGQTLRQLECAGVTRRLSKTRVEYINDGEGLNYVCDEHSVSLYDKLSEMMDAGHTEMVRTIGSSQKVLRFEVRLTTVEQIKFLLKKLNLTSPTQEITLQTVFSRAISTAVLNHRWDELFMRDETVVGTEPIAPMQLFEAVLSVLPRRSAIKAIQYVGWDALRRDVGGLGQLNSILKDSFRKGVWYAHKRKWRKIDCLVTAWEPSAWFQEATKQIRQNNPLRMITTR